MRSEEIIRRWRPFPAVASTAVAALVLCSLAAAAAAQATDDEQSPGTGRPSGTEQGDDEEAAKKAVTSIPQVPGIRDGTLGLPSVGTAEGLRAALDSKVFQASGTDIGAFASLGGLNLTSNIAAEITGETFQSTLPRVLLDGSPALPRMETINMSSLGFRGRWHFPRAQIRVTYLGFQRCVPLSEGDAAAIEDANAKAAAAAAKKAEADRAKIAAEEAATLAEATMIVAEAEKTRAEAAELAGDAEAAERAGASAAVLSAAADDARAKAEDAKAKAAAAAAQADKAKTEAAQAARPAVRVVAEHRSAGEEGAPGATCEGQYAAEAFANKSAGWTGSIGARFISRSLVEQAETNPMGIAGEVTLQYARQTDSTNVPDRNLNWSLFGSLSGYHMGRAEDTLGGTVVIFPRVDVWRVTAGGEISSNQSVNGAVLLPRIGIYGTLARTRWENEFTTGSQARMIAGTEMQAAIYLSGHFLQGFQGMVSFGVLKPYGDGEEPQFILSLIPSVGATLDGEKK